MKTMIAEIMYHLYILQCADDTLYTGITTNLTRRLHEHNCSPRAAKYTRARRPVTLIYTQKFRDRSTASKAEAQIKKLSRVEKMRLIDEYLKNMKKQNGDSKFVIYQTKNGAIELRGDTEKETIWATQAQITEIFDIDRTVVTKHIGNILKNKEVNEKSNVQKMHIANSDKPIAIYSLDIILAVGYRANSARAIQFRQWATKTLRQHITKGFTLNPKVIKK